MKCTLFVVLQFLRYLYAVPSHNSEPLTSFFILYLPQLFCCSFIREDPSICIQQLRIHRQTYHNFCTVHTFYILYLHYFVTQMYGWGNWQRRNHCFFLSKSWEQHCFNDCSTLLHSYLKLNFSTVMVCVVSFAAVLSLSPVPSLEVLSCGRMWNEMVFEVISCHTIFCSLYKWNVFHGLGKLC